MYPIGGLAKGPTSCNPTRIGWNPLGRGVPRRGRGQEAPDWKPHRSDDSRGGRAGRRGSNLPAAPVSVRSRLGARAVWPEPEPDRAARRGGRAGRRAGLRGGGLFRGRGAAPAARRGHGGDRQHLGRGLPVLCRPFGRFNMPLGGDPERLLAGARLPVALAGARRPDLRGDAARAGRRGGAHAAEWDGAGDGRDARMAGGHLGDAPRARAGGLRCGPRGGGDAADRHGRPGGRTPPDIYHFVFDRLRRTRAWSTSTGSREDRAVPAPARLLCRGGQ